MTRDTPTGGNNRRAILFCLVLDHRQKRMVNNCRVVGCTNRVGKAAGLCFFRFPISDSARCAQWVAAVRRSGWKPTDSSRICGAHFVNGESAIFTKFSSIKNV